MLCLFSAFFWPALASVISMYVPEFITDYLSYWPQLSLPYDDIVVRDIASNTLVFTNFTGKAINVVQWVIVVALFSFAVGNIKNRYFVVLLSFVVITVIPIIVYQATNYFGFTLLIVNP